MKTNQSNKIVLGTAQFGLDYGILNCNGKVNKKTVKSILSEAEKLKINMIDTAINYGNSENVLGEAGINNFEVITKLPPFERDSLEASKYTVSHIESSMLRLGVNQIYCVLMHRSDDLLNCNGQNILKSLNRLKSDGVISKLGVSIYSPVELEELIAKGIYFDVVQAPFNIFDRRMQSSKWFEKLKDMGVEIHIRSIFLQGLLLATRDRIPISLSKWKTHFDYWNNWVETSGLSRLEACINFVCSIQEIDKIVVGIESLEQFKAISLSFSQTSRLIPPKELIIDDLNLIDPRLWR